MKQLEAIKGLSEDKIKKIQEATMKLVDMGFTTAAIISEHRKTMTKLSTGSAELDKVLGGGIETGAITELFGEFRTGKTQLCHMLCVTAQMTADSGGGEGKALFIDTEGTFRPERICSIAARFGANGENTHVSRSTQLPSGLRLTAHAYRFPFPHLQRKRRSRTSA